MRGSFFDVDVVNRSRASLLDGSVAEGRSEESAVLAMLLTGLAVNWDVFEMLGFVEGLSLNLGRELVVEVRLLNLLVLSEHVKGRLSDWDHLLDHVPEDALAERSSGEAAGVSPSAVEVDLLHELSEVDQLVLAHASAILDHLSQESVVKVTQDFEVIVGNHFEDETKDSVGEGRATLLVGGKVRLDGMHNMKLHVHELSVNGVLSWSMEVVLHAAQLDVSAGEVWVEETGGLGVEMS